MLVYPAQFTPEPEPAGAITVTFRDVPEAITCGDTPEEAMEMAVDALSAALSFYIEANRPLPTPSPVSQGETPVPVSADAMAKVGLYTAMRDAGIDTATLAARLGTDAASVSTMLNTAQPTPLEDIERALAALGKRLDVRVQDAA